MYKSKQLHPWIKNIHSYTNTMDEKWIFLFIINRDISGKLCRHLVETKKPSPPPLQSSISMASSQDNDKLGKSINGCSKDKGMQTQVRKYGAQIHYSFFALTNSPRLMHPSSSIYSPSIGSEG